MPHLLFRMHFLIKKKRIRNQMSQLLTRILFFYFISSQGYSKSVLVLLSRIFEIRFATCSYKSVFPFHFIPSRKNALYFLRKNQFFQGYNIGTHTIGTGILFYCLLYLCKRLRHQFFQHIIDLISFPS